MLIDFLIQGSLNWPWWKIVLYTLVATHITIACVTIYLHRGQAHRVVKLHWLPEHFARFWLWLNTGMVTIEWQSIHLKHHAKCETVDDPHSPQIYGLKTVLLQGAELYRAEAKVKGTMERYGYGAPNDWVERNIYSRHVKLGVSLMLIINFILFGVIGLSVWAVQMAWIPLFAAGVVNGVGHYSGYRSFSSPDKSTNIVPWGILIGGEELHNNHHTYPTSAKLSVKWYEFDIGWTYIRLLELLGLATVNRDHLAPRGVFSLSANTPAETVKVVVALRFEMLAQFDDLTKDALSGGAMHVPQLRADLIALWEDKTLTAEAQVENFRLWCFRASRSGVLYLDGLVSKLPFIRVV